MLRSYCDTSQNLHRDCGPRCSQIDSTNTSAKPSARFAQRLCHAYGAKYSACVHDIHLRVLVKSWACDALQEAVRQVVVHLWEKHEEVPYIAAYRKQLVGDLAALHKEDTPQTTDDDQRASIYPIGTMQVRMCTVAPLLCPYLGRA